MELRILTAADVRRALPMAEAIAGMKQAFAALTKGTAHLPLRTQIDVPAAAGVALFMPAYLEDLGHLAVKVVSVFPGNVQQDLPTIHGLVLALDPSTGQPLALLEGASLTAIRTGAASGAATDLLARSDAERVTIFGSGVQARTQLEAVCTVRPIRSVRVYSPNHDHARAFAHDMLGQGPIPDLISITEDPETALAGADIVCTATTATRPVFPGRSLEPGVHVNAVGSFRPDMQEVDVETVRRALVVVDSREAVLAEAGDLIIPLEQGEIDRDHIYAELGEIAAGQKEGRTDPRQLTYFKSVGLAVQDAVAAGIALENARRLDLGTVVHL